MFMQSPLIVMHSLAFWKYESSHAHFLFLSARFFGAGRYACAGAYNARDQIAPRADLGSEERGG